MSSQATRIEPALLSTHPKRIGSDDQADIEGHQILGPLNSSLTGRTYLARHRELGRMVVIKLLHTNADTKTRARFEREARALSQVSHDHVAGLLGFGTTTGGRRYMIVEHVEGRDLRQTLARWGRLPERRALRLLDQLARALHAVHTAGLVHRNLKPESVLLGQGRDGKELVKLTNFGLVRGEPADGELGVTRTGPMLGTPRYWSPEQVLGEPADARSDIYAFGVLAYELLTGHTPFQSTTTEGFAWQHVVVAPPRALDGEGRPRLRPEIERFLDRCLAKHRDQRYESMLEVRRALKRARTRIPPAPSPTLRERLNTPELWLAIGIAFFVGVLAALVLR